MKIKQSMHRAICHYKNNLSALEMAFSENTIRVPETERWNYAIPENYTNYRDGFILADEATYRWQPLINFNGEILYFFHSVQCHRLAPDEKEKLYLYDRRGHKYTFAFVFVSSLPLLGEDETNLLCGGNPSYFAFLPRVKRYKPNARARYEKFLASH